jgi:hypothetical protein
MNMLVSIQAHILLLCLVGILAGGLGCSQSSPSVRVVGHVSSNDLVEIKKIVRQEVMKRVGSPDNHPIRSVEVTTNNSYWSDHFLLISLEERPKTNSQINEYTQKLRQRLQSRSEGDATNPAVYVWYADTNARWGEAGYTLEKDGTGWKIISELFR